MIFNKEPAQTRCLVCLLVLPCLLILGVILSRKLG